MKRVSHILSATAIISAGVTGALTAALPGNAATLALSEGTALFNNFTQSPIGTDTSVTVDTLTISSGSPVVVEGTASAFFEENPPTALNTVISQAFGSGSNYLGIAESEAAILGQFEIAANTVFGFDFLGDLNLQTQIDDPSRERASAAVGIVFALLSDASVDEPPIVLDAFEVFAQLQTPGDNDQLTAQATPDINWQFDQADLTGAPDGLTESAIATFSGTYNRFFEQSALLTLVEVKTSQAKVKAVPEFSSLIALLLSSCALIGVKRRQKLHA